MEPEEDYVQQIEREIQELQQTLQQAKQLRTSLKIQRGISKRHTEVDRNSLAAQKRYIQADLRGTQYARNNTEEIDPDDHMWMFRNIFYNTPEELQQREKKLKKN